MDTSASSTSAAEPGQPAMSHEEYARSRHSVWLGAAALFTDEIGRVLLVKPTYRTQWLLPGGCMEAGEGPDQTCWREVQEELGLSMPLGRLLAVHWLAPGHPDRTEGVPFPGEVRYVMDGGTLTPRDIARMRLPQDELSGYEFLDSRGAAERMIPVDAQILLAALRAAWPAPPPTSAEAGASAPFRPWTGARCTPGPGPDAAGPGTPAAPRNTSPSRRRGAGCSHPTAG